MTDVREMLSKQKTVRIGHLTFQSRFEWFVPRTNSTHGQDGEARRVRFSVSEGRQDRARGFPHAITDHIPPLSDSSLPAFSEPD
jgi:hypothetical protein